MSNAAGTCRRMLSVGHRARSVLIAAADRFDWFGCLVVLCALQFGSHHHRHQQEV